MIFAAAADDIPNRQVTGKESLDRDGGLRSGEWWLPPTRRVRVRIDQNLSRGACGVTS